MKPEQMRIAIAELCGWVFKQVEGGADGWRSWHSPDGKPAHLFELPNYPVSLDAMHEAEKILTDEQWCDWFDIVGKVIGYETPIPPADYTERTMIQKMTAAQRAQTFLRTIGRWEWPKQRIKYEYGGEIDED